MNLIQELHNLFEAEVPGENKVELADLIKHFPNNHKKAIEKLWGGPRLALNGVPFFADGGEDIFDKAEDAVKKWAADGGEFPMNFSSIDFELDGEEYSIELDYQENLDPTKDGQEVYMGYDPKSGHLYQGYDIHCSEETFNEEWDKAFRDETGIDFDYDDAEHQKAFHKAFEEFAHGSHGSGHIMFELVPNGDSFEADDVESGEKIFYPTGYNLAKRQGLIDLRLD